jgi:hypothetical protein
VRSLPKGDLAIRNYTATKTPIRKKTRTEPPTPPPRICGWHPQHTTYNTHPINPDLDAIPTGAFEVTTHPTSLDLVLVHAPNGRLISPISKARLTKLAKIYRPQTSTLTLPEAIANALLRHKASTYREPLTKERKLHKTQTQQQQLEFDEPWHIPDILYDTLRSCFDIKRVIHCNPMTLPLRATEYISHDPRDGDFGALPFTHTAWPDASLALPGYQPAQLTVALEQAIYSAHAHRHTQPSSHVLILPNWQHSPYLARNLHTSYVQKLASIPYLQHQSTHKKHAQH